MRNYGIIANVYGYLICVVAVLLFIHSAAGFVNSAFRFAGPSGMRHHHRVAAIYGPGSERWAWHRMQPQALSKPGAVAPSVPGTFGARAAARGRWELAAVRGLVLNLILLAIAALLFRWHWHWLQRPQPT
jgi:hypothetical protein